MNPTVGMAATICYYSDRAAATVVYVSETGYKVIVKEDHAVRVDNNGMSEIQKYEYTPNPLGREHVFYRNQHGDYAQRGKSLHLGDRRAYHDYSF
jgi:hypothetical protein